MSQSDAHIRDEHNLSDDMIVETLKELEEKIKVLHYPDVIKELKCFKKTSTFDIRKSVIGKKHSRMYICYKDLEDKDTVVFIVRIIKKIK